MVQKKYLIILTSILLICLATTSVIASPMEKNNPNQPDSIALHVVLSPDGQAANLAWSGLQETINELIIERSTDGGATWPKKFRILSPSTTYQDSAVAYGGTYWYRLTPHLNTGDAPDSNIVSLYIIDLAPTPPTAQAVVNNSHSITLSWDNTSTTTHGYTIERAIASGSSLVFKRVTTIQSPLITTWTDAKLAKSTTYFYQVRAFNPYGSSYASNQITITTPGKP
jgi:hypothetical protein